MDLVHEFHLCHPPDVPELADRPDHRKEKQKHKPSVSKSEVPSQASGLVSDSANVTAAAMSEPYPKAAALTKSDTQADVPAANNREFESPSLLQLLQMPLKCSVSKSEVPSQASEPASDSAKATAAASAAHPGLTQILPQATQIAIAEASKRVQDFFVETLFPGRRENDAVEKMQQFAAQSERDRQQARQKKKDAADSAAAEVNAAHATTASGRQQQAAAAETNAQAAPLDKIIFIQI